MPTKPEVLPIPRWLPTSWAGLSFLGFLDAGFLTAQHYFKGALPCVITSGCEQVTTSVYSSIFGVPIALLGALYYLTIFLLVVALIDTKNSRLALWIARLTVVGFVVSLVLLGLQAFVIGAYCFYCLGSALTSTLLFAVSVHWWRSRRRLA